jgi:hypothetical protein
MTPYFKHRGTSMLSNMDFGIKPAHKKAGIIGNQSGSHSKAHHHAFSIYIEDL